MGVLYASIFCVIKVLEIVAKSLKKLLHFKLAKLKKSVSVGMIIGGIVKTIKLILK